MQSGPPSGSLRFNPSVSTPRSAVALVFDMEGFSKFFYQPDAQVYVSKYLNRIFESMSIVINGGKAYWEPEKTEHTPLARPAHEKFLGDGAMYLWLQESGPQPPLRTVALINRLWNMRKWFGRIVEACADDVPVVNIPRRIRMGLAGGPVYELATAEGQDREYIGYCINLASRLQRYCPDLGFIVSARLGLPEATISQHGYAKVVATKLKGFPKEIVIVDQEDLAKLDPYVRRDLFEEAR